jgi:hypothetical protein
MNLLINAGKYTIAGGISLAVLLFLLKWLEFRFVIVDHALEIYIGVIAFLFTGLGIWLALKLARPKVETSLLGRHLKYANHVMTQAKANGATEAQLASKAKDMEFVYTMYKTPLGVIAATYMEVLPLGAVVALISALILRRRSGKLSGVFSN